MNKQCTLAAKEAYSSLGCMRKRVASRLTEVILPSAQPWWRTSECWVYCSLVSTRKDRDLLETVQKRTTNMVEGLVHLSYKEGLRELGLFSLDKGRLKGTLSMCINTWWKGTKKSYLDSHVYWQDKRQWAQIGTQVFPYELKKILFFFDCQVIKHWCRLLRRMWSLCPWRWSKFWEAFSNWLCLSRWVGLDNLRMSLLT